MRLGVVSRRGLVAITLAAVVSMLSPASAAQNIIIAGPGNASLPVYYTQTVVVQKGKTVNFVNLDIPLHDVRHTGGLFYSKLIGIGKQTPVVGVKTLGKGAYNFYCSLHPRMKGVLRVI